MEQRGKWKPVKQLGVGGQGTVYLALDTETFNAEDAKQEIAQALLDISLTAHRKVQASHAELLAKTILAYGKSDDPKNFGALKVLHSSKDAGAYSKQLERMKKEIKALRKLSHPHIVSILDENLDDRWFVTQFFAKGTLANNLKRYRGDMLAALEAFQPLVEAVAAMHAEGLLHRDIKPENVFISKEGNLVLGDLGLVFFMDDKRSRITETFENVGSRDWMPAWAMGMRVEEIKPSFDVFSLGKLLWSMLSGTPRLQLWYHHKLHFELEKIFPESYEIRWARELLDRCIVEEEQDCLGNARELLGITNLVLRAVRRNCQVVRENVARRCRVCGLGQYVQVANENSSEVRNFGLNPTGSKTFKIFSCNDCGHTELFHLKNPGAKPPAWR